MGRIAGGWSQSLFMVLALIPSVTHAQQNPGQQPAGYPSKPVRILVGSSIGGGVDLAVRPVAHRLTERWGRQVIVENRDGASGAIAMEITAKAIPDGYTLFVAGNTMILTGAQKKVPFDIRTAYAPIVRMTSQPYLLLVNPALPYNSVKDLIAYAKSKPGAINYGTAGIGSTTHIGTELLSSMAGINLVNVPYKGNAPALVDLMAGRIQMMFASGVAAGPQVKSGKVKALAVAGLRRMQAFPNLPTIAESGVPGYELANSFGLYAPAGTPAPVLLLINREVSEFMNSAEVKQRLEVDATEAAPPQSPAQFKAEFIAEVNKWEKFFKTSGLKFD
jgi:tripartite-type tricarboxylate transporter receptor subunit TctC